MTEDAHTEIRELRRVVEEQKAEIERLRARLSNVTGPMGPKVAELLKIFPESEMEKACMSALTEGAGVLKIGNEGVSHISNEELRGKLRELFEIYSVPRTMKIPPCPPLDSDVLEEGI